VRTLVMALAYSRIFFPTLTAASLHCDSGAMRPRREIFSALDCWITRQHSAISLVTGALAVLGVGVMFFGVAPF